jgi:restriction endonuclease S subunit
VNSGDVIVSSIEGSLNSIALITEKYNNSLCSTGFFVLKSSKINSESLLVFLKSPFGQMQLKKGCSGTILTEISKDELKKIIIPNLPLTIQSLISSKIQTSFSNREKSSQLLEAAKKAVEIAIEENEESGLKYIKEII